MSNTKALIYCRVSSQQQVIEGTGLSSQEQRCKEYCRIKKYDVEKIFADEGISGGLFDRPKMNELIEYIDKHPAKSFVIVFDDLKRFARDIEVHIRLRREFDTRGVKLESPNFNFENTEEGRFVEGIIALTAQLERGQNRRQVIQKQKARLESGYWPFCNPPGLVFIRESEHGKLLVPDDVISPIFKEAIEKYANGYFKTQTHVTEFIAGKYDEMGINRKISNHGVKNILSQILYAGYIEYSPWEVSLRNGKHQGFITLDTYNRAQGRLRGVNKARPRKDYLEDFALRGFVHCECCGRPLTSSWNQGRSKKYANYTCKTSGCPFRWKSIPKTRLHSQFRQLLVQNKISPNFAKLTEAVLLDVWGSKQQLELQKVTDNQRFTNEYQAQIDKLVELVSRTSDYNLIEIYQDKITSLNRKLEATNNQDEDDIRSKFTIEQFGTALKRTLNTLENPLNIWVSANSAHKRDLVNFYFDKPLMFNKEKGFGIVEYRHEINLIQSIASGNCHMVEMVGVEPTCF